MSNGLTTDAGLSIPSGLAPSAGLAGPNAGLAFQGFGGGTPPVISNGILQEGSTTDFIMQEDGTSYILQE